MESVARLKRRTAKQLGLFVVTCVATLFSCNIAGESKPGTGSTENTFNLTVARHAGQSLSEATVDAIFSEASELLQVKDPACDDVACPVTFQRSGSLGTFTTASTFVTTEAQLDAIFAEDEDFKVVTMMTGVCGVTDPGDMSEILGCASAGGSVVIVSNAPADVWAHEWGHVQGLYHRDDCATNIMHSYNLNTDAVNETEKTAFLTPTPSGFFKNHRLMDTPIACATFDFANLSGEDFATWLRDLLSRQYSSGFPKALLDGIPEEVTEEHLLPLMSCGSNEHARANAFRIAGLIGKTGLIEPIIEYLRSVEGPLATEQIAATNEAILALGRLAYLDDSGAAISFLIARTSPEAWTDQSLCAATNLAEPSVSSLDEVLARISVMSLGICEHPDALSHLSAMHSSIVRGRLSYPWLLEQVEEALARKAGKASSLRQGSGAARIR